MKSLFFVAALATVSLASAASSTAQSAPPQEQTPQNLEAKKWLNDGIQAYKNGDIEPAIADFTRAKELDPTLVKARLYLATAYASRFIPGATSAENTEFGEKALREYQDILATQPNNVAAIDGAGSILYNMAASPWDVKKMEESKSYHQKHIELAPNDPEPYYWIGVIDWSMAYRTNLELRTAWTQKTGRPLAAADPLPDELRAQFQEKSGANVQEGMDSIKKAVALRPDYDDAMAYLNLLYRQRSDMDATEAERHTDEIAADELVEKVKAIKEKKLQQAEQSQ
jgi:tetratricopeptide (TPR) repeat protein